MDVIQRIGCNQSVIRLLLYFNLLNGGQIYQIHRAYWVVYSRFITTMKLGKVGGGPLVGDLGEDEKVLIWSQNLERVGLDR